MGLPFLKRLISQTNPGTQVPIRDGEVPYIHYEGQALGKYRAFGALDVNQTHQNRPNRGTKRAHGFDRDVRRILAGTA
jgi:hypothetical protein